MVKVMRARTLIYSFVITFAFGSLLSIPSVTFAATSVTSNITSDTEWTLSGSPYVISSNISIASSTTLTIDRGVVAEIGLGVDVLVDGSLFTQGDASNPVVFTSVSDSDASTSTPSGLSWGQIIIGAGATADLSHTVLSYGGARPPYEGGGGDIIVPLNGVIANSGALSFVDSSIVHTDFSGGIYSEGVLTFTRSSVDETYTDSALDLHGTTTISQSSFGVGEIIRVSSANVTFSESSASEPIEVSASTIQDGGANIAPLVLDWNDLENDTTFLAPPFINMASDLFIEPDTTLHVAPGAIVKLYGNIDVQGTLIAGSTTNAATTTFTAMTDDGVGGNTNPTDGAVSATAGDWLGFVAEEGSTITLHHALLKYAGDPEAWWMYDAFAEGADTKYAGQLVNLGGTVSIDDSMFTNPLSNDVTQIAGTTTVIHSRFPDGTSFAYITDGVFTAQDNSITLPGTGIENDGTAEVDAKNNWWGDASGPYNDDANPSGLGASVSTNVLFDPWLTSDPFAPTTKVGSSNVLFLPGIEGSRLYEDTACGASSEEKLWEPYSFLGLFTGAGDAKMKSLTLDASGRSVCDEIYTKVGDIIDTVGGEDIYRPIIDEMNELVASTTLKMNAWEPVAYDWRLSLNDLLTNGKEVDGKIYYGEATDTPYIEQELYKLVARSATGKVTIIAHSNGGLVAKALLKKLGKDEAARLVDRLVLVGAPQSGAPEGVGSLLVGYDAGIYRLGFPIVSSAVARAFAENSPMAYHLLPSTAYLSSTVDDPTHPVVHFSGSAYEKQRAAYGNSLVTQRALDDYLLATAGDREQPNDGNISAAKILNPSLLAYANATHEALDSWVPPASIEVDQIAGWGNDTVAGIDFYTNPRSAASALSSATELPEYRPIFTEDGDGIVPVPSALAMASSSNVKRYWVDLTNSGISHANIFAAIDLQNLIANLAQGSLSALPSRVSTSAPVSTNPKKLIFTLHSPLTLKLTDADGNTTGLSSDGSITQDIPEATYGQFGETQYIIVPQGSQYTLGLAGQGSGTFSLDMQEYVGGTVATSSTIANVPVATSTQASLTIGDGISTASALTVDEQGDGKDILSVTPKVGETVSYEPTAPTSTTPGAGGGPGYDSYQSAGSISSPVAVPVSGNEASTMPAFSTVVTPAPLSPVATSSSALRPVLKTEPLRKPVAVLKSTPSTGSEEVNHASTVPLPHTATTYDAVSQQPLLSEIAHAFYTGIQSAWAFLLRLL